MSRKRTRSALLSDAAVGRCSRVIDRAPSLASRSWSEVALLITNNAPIGARALQRQRTIPNGRCQDIPC
eukprot:scaffold2107_cov222-Pinguiococcus_pyrenoidosus.AAC.13